MTIKDCTHTSNLLSFSIPLPLLNGLIRRYCRHRCCCSLSPLFANRRHYRTLAFPTTTSHSHSPCITISSRTCMVVSATESNNYPPSFINI
mmetsp:Transcript_10663/g.12169  ORF Transcript_10663/g.12169 Transcript_10663/m.12169 type:complete len:91 (+) Transcript_10663:96-368(+)